MPLRQAELNIEEENDLLDRINEAVVGWQGKAQLLHPEANSFLGHNQFLIGAMMRMTLEVVTSTIRQADGSPLSHLDAAKVVVQMLVARIEAATDTPTEGTKE